MAFKPTKGNRKLFKDSRRIPVSSKEPKDLGERGDTNKYYRCWNCGFICNEERDALGDAYSTSGNYAYEAIRTAQGYVETDELDITPVLGGSIVDYFTLLELGVDGSTPKTIRYTFEALVSSGCPVCGTLNWRGDY